MRARPLLVARYYVLTTASLAAGLYDWLRHGTPAGLGRRRRARGDGRRASSTSRVARGSALLAAVAARSRCSRRSRSGSSRRGHPIYRQRRVGRDGARVRRLKLRTMVSGAERIGAGLAVDEGDARITRVGALLRRTSLDELPNLVNVLRRNACAPGAP